MIHLLSSEGAALIESDVELVVIPAGSIDVDAVGVMNVAWTINESGECTIIMDGDFHVIIRAFSSDVCK